MTSEISSEAKTSAPPEEKLLDDFIEDCRLRDLTPETIRCYLSNLRIFHRFMEKSEISLLIVGREELRSFLLYLKDERKVSKKRVENYFATISGFYEYLTYEGYVQGNQVLPFRKRYVRSYKKESRPAGVIKIISVEEMGLLINSITDVRDKTIVTLLAKTGIRRGELLTIDLDGIDWDDWSITLKRHKKRSNTTVFFDDECASVLLRWLRTRGTLYNDEKPLFPGLHLERTHRNAVYNAVTRWASRIGLHDTGSDKRIDHFSPHNCRHWFTTTLRRAGMSREFIKELRGDKRGDAIDIYDHIDREELRRSYLACMPRLGIV